MGQQILLFKIELCPDVKSLYQSHFIARPLMPAAIEHFFGPPPDPDRTDVKFRNESSFETAKCDSFADDNTAGTLFEFDSLSALKTFLSPSRISAACGAMRKKPLLCRSDTSYQSVRKLQV